MKKVPRLVETAVKDSGVYYMEIVFEISKTRFNKLENSVFGTDFTYKGKPYRTGHKKDGGIEAIPLEKIGGRRNSAEENTTYLFKAI